MGRGVCPFSIALFAGTALTYLHLRKSLDSNANTNNVSNEEPFHVIFVLGGPGAGKGTQCERLSQDGFWCHLSAGELLRTERQTPGSQFAQVINSTISVGGIVPSEITVQLIQKAMRVERRKCGQRNFLIDGFPRNEGNVNAWKEVVGEEAVVDFVLFFECPEDVLTSRLLERGKTSGRSDDSISVIRKRFATYRDESIPIIEMFQKEGKVRKIFADRSIDDVYKEVQSIIIKE